MKLLFTLLLLTSWVYALEEELPIASKSAGEFVSPSHGQLVTQTHSSFFPKVNPITGEYNEEETDFIVAGCQPLSFRRFYNHLNSPDPRYGAWRVNPESSFVANFQWNKSSLFASVGDDDGSMLFLGECKNAYLSDGRTVMSYCLDTQNSHGYTNLGQDPRQTQLNFWPEYGNEGKSRYLGFVQDGSGRKREFYTPWYNWHKESRIHLDPRKWVVKLSPQNWIPYQLIVTKELLPNGNVIVYEHQKWQDEIHHPFPQLIRSITAYNHDESQKLGEIHFDYIQLQLAL